MSSSSRVDEGEGLGGKYAVVGSVPGQKGIHTQRF